MKPKILWAREEFRLVFEWGIAHKAELETLRAPMRLKKAQEATLPTERHRPLDPVLVSKFSKALRTGTFEYPKLPSERILKKQPIVEPPKKVVLPEFQPPPDPNDPLEQVFLSMLKRPRVRDAIVALVQERFEVTMPEQGEAQQVRKVHIRHRERLPKVLISGLKGHQIEEVRKNFHSGLNLSFWFQDKSLEELKHKATKCDVAVGFINFLSHSADAIMKARAPRYLPVAGGVDTLKGVLEQIRGSNA